MSLPPYCDPLEGAPHPSEPELTQEPAVAPDPRESRIVPENVMEAKIRAASAVYEAEKEVARSKGQSGRVTIALIERRYGFRKDALRRWRDQ